MQKSGRVNPGWNKNVGFQAGKLAEQAKDRCLQPNLLMSDGTSSYEYDPFNRLSKVVTGNDTYEFNYDPQGNRVGQAVNVSWTYYDLDLNAGLTEVLAAQDADYLYGLGSTPLAQNDPGDIGYLFIDGLPLTLRSRVLRQAYSARSC